jgi:hypothetical protein
MMKCRAIAIIDMEIEGGFQEAAAQEKSIQQLISDYVKDNKSVLHWQCELRDRRGEPGNMPLSKMKFRAN